ncbi:MAG: hypothetical protein HZA46_18560 [Planctomycetales bacterium]|nr:hypothetical protein [Planctomycetales bacterium]
MSFASRFLFAVVFVGLAGTANTADSKAGDFGSGKLQVGDASREHRLLVPKTVDLLK